MAGANRKLKEQEVQILNKRFETVSAAIVSHYAGVTVEKMTAFRGKLREHGIELKVIKNTLATRAIKGTDLAELESLFKGPTALAYTDEDPIALAKALKDFAGEEEKFVVQGGVLRGKVLERDDVISLANVPSREVLLGRLVGSLQSPYAGMVHGLSGILRKLVFALDAVRREKEKQG
ncbi:MAG: 50S ribosomal protein L10 [Bdellovibrionales bacterium]|nr:50S ribosomal protein L10 [Bdellovibrionales bacterium]